MENLESVKSIAESNFKMCLIGNIQGFHFKGILQIFYRSLQFFLKVTKSSYLFSRDSRLYYKLNYEKLELNELWLTQVVRFDSDGKNIDRIDIFWQNVVEAMLYLRIPIHD